MPIALNPDTGEALRLDDGGAWVPTKIAKHPDTGETLALDGAAWVPVGAKKPEAPKEPGTGLDATLQGLTFGFGDELNAGQRAGMRWITNKLGITQDDGQGLSDLYDARLKGERDRLKQYQKDNPVGSTVREVVGSLASGVPAARGLAAAAPAVFDAGSGLLRTAGSAAAQGAVQGAVSGFGSGEGGLGERLGSAGVGAAIGGVTGGLLPPLLAAGGKVSGRVADAFGMRNAEEQATRQLLRAFERDGVSPDDAAQRLEQWQAAGAKPAMLFDLGGENVKGLARSAAGVPGEAKNRAVQALESRQGRMDSPGGQAERIGDDASAIISPDVDYFATNEALGTARAQAGRPAYEHAFETAGPVHSDRLVQFLDDPIMRKGLGRGMEIQRLESLAEGRPFNPREYGVTGFNEAGDPIIEGVPNLRLLDAGKRGLDEIINDARDPLSGRINWNERLRAIDQVRQSYVREIDNLTATTPGDVSTSPYRQARQAWSGPSQSLDALHFGREFMSFEPEEIARRMARMGEGDREFARAGVVRQLRELMRDAPDGADAVKRIFGSAGKRRQIEAAIGAEDFAAFRQRMLIEGEAFRNAQQVSPKVGSQTDLRAAERQDMAQDVLPNLVSAVIHPTPGNLVSRAGSMLYRRGQGINPSTADQLARVMYNPDPAANRTTLTALQSRRTDDASRQALNAELVRLLMGASGNAAGQLPN